ncbi:MAG: type VI secretion system tip protein VgrG [Pseudomonas sp.]
MFALANQPRFTLTVDGNQNELKVLEFTGKEAISEPYRFDLELVSEHPSIELESLLHGHAFLSFGSPNTGVHGQIFRVGQGDTRDGLTRYQVSLVPHLTRLGQRINQRIFQKKSVQAIIAQILNEHGIQGDAFQFRLGSQYAAREYCVQYAETDLAFIQRLCAELGIHYHFKHSPQGHVVVFGDDQAFFPPLPNPTVYRPDSGMAVDAPSIKYFNVRLETRTSVVTLRDYNFQKPRPELESRVDNRQVPVLEDYHFPGQFIDRDHGKVLARRALQRHNADYRQAEGRGDEPALVSGHLLELTHHPRHAWNDHWLITRIEHRGRQPQVLGNAGSRDTSDDFQGYCNTFLATPSDVLFRPPLIGKPPVSGYQTAVVTGPKDREIHCDEYGRVKVQLAWDRHGQHDEHSSCWLRVATGWAHDGYGTALIPRVGMEVLVGFVDGDVDKPLVMGCLPNGANPSPLNLPADHTRSIFRSRSSPGGGGYNELRIEDRKGAEEIYLRAQRDWTQEVFNDLRVQVANQRNAVVGANDSLQVRGDRHISVNSQTLKANGQLHISAGQQIVIDGGASVTLQAGGHWINITPAGIFSSVPIQVGGAPMPALGAPSTQRALAVLSAAQILSLQSPAAFCEECARCKDGVCAA